jgi:hypothetical protein
MTDLRPGEHEAGLAAVEARLEAVGRWSRLLDAQRAAWQRGDLDLILTLGGEAEGAVTALERAAPALRRLDLLLADPACSGPRAEALRARRLEADRASTRAADGAAFLGGTLAAGRQAVLRELRKLARLDARDRTPRQGGRPAPFGARRGALLDATG